MRKCVICNRRKVFKTSYYFCNKCFNKYKNEEWFKEFKKLAEQQGYSDRKFQRNFLGFDDLIWVGGRKRKIDKTGEEVWVDGKIKSVQDILDEKAEQEYLSED